VRSIPRRRDVDNFSSVPSSTAISPEDQSTWVIAIDTAERKLFDILDAAFEEAERLFNPPDKLRT
jgi:hypothetical protein